MRTLWLPGRPLSVVLITAAALLAGASEGLLGVCGPFTDVSDPGFCPFVLEIFYLGITTGTSPTTYDPTSNVSRLQMAAFLSRTVDGVLKRGSRRASLNQAWTTQALDAVALTTVGTFPLSVKSDGADVWVANNGGTVSRVRGSDGRLLETWTGAGTAIGLLSAMGRILVTGETSPGKLYAIDPSRTAGAVTTVASNLGDSASGIAFDGARVWTANTGGSVSIVTPGASVPWTVTTVTSGFVEMTGALYDGSNVWVTSPGLHALLKLDSSAAVLQTVTLVGSPQFPIFDGANIWVPDFTASQVVVVRASNGTILSTLTGNGLKNPYTAAFDGQRLLVTNNGANVVSLWKAADLTPIGSFGVGAGQFGACSDGVSFWVAMQTANELARF